MDEILNLIESVSEGFPAYFLKIERKIFLPTFELNSSRCMHDPSFMALALIVSDKKILNAKTRH